MADPARALSRQRALAAYVRNREDPMLTTDQKGTTRVSLPAIEEDYRRAEGAEDPALHDPGLYGAGPPRTDWPRVARGGALALLAGLAFAALLVSLAGRWQP